MDHQPVKYFLYEIASNNDWVLSSENEAGRHT